MKKWYFVMAMALLAVWISTSAQAHMFWLNASDYAPEAGETIWIELGFGHQYPRDEIMKEGRLDRIYALGPEGKESPVEQIFPSFYKFTPKSKGAYQIIAALKPGFVSKTADGHKLGNKKDFPDTRYCFAFRMSAKTVITVGKKNKEVSQTTQKPLEIVAMTSPADLKVGDTLPLKVMFEGKPLSGASVSAVYEGFTEEKNHWAQEATTNADGLVQIKMTAKGPWLFTATHKESYPDKAECDDYSYRASLTVSF
jgi:uncharacterized GH25 family protein